MALRVVLHRGLRTQHDAQDRGGSFRQRDDHPPDRDDIQAEHVNELERLMRDGGFDVLLDLGEVGLVDAKVVQFLAGCATRGVQLQHCPPYVAEWIGQQQEGNR